MIPSAGEGLTPAGGLLDFTGSDEEVQTGLLIVSRVGGAP